jgi:YggT family protein
MASRGTFFSWLFWLLEVYAYLILARIIASWMNPVHDTPILLILFKITNQGYDILQLIPAISLGGQYLYDLIPIMIIIIYIGIRTLFRVLSQ